MSYRLTPSARHVEPAGRIGPAVEDLDDLRPPLDARRARPPRHGVKPIESAAERHPRGEPSARAVGRQVGLGLDGDAVLIEPQVGQPGLARRDRQLRGRASGRGTRLADRQPGRRLARRQGRLRAPATADLVREPEHVLRRLDLVEREQVAAVEPGELLLGRDRGVEQAIGRVRHPVGRRLVGRERGEEGPPLDVPEPDRRVVASAGEETAVGPGDEDVRLLVVLRARFEAGPPPRAVGTRTARSTCPRPRPPATRRRR